MQRIGQWMLLMGCLFFTAGTGWAQQNIGYVDSDQILEQMPEYASIQKEVDRLAGEWRDELEARQEEVDEMFEEYQARELLYTDEERRKRREAIMQAEEEVEQLRSKYFGPEGQLFTRQEELMRPLQERILTAVESVAESEDYDYVFDKAGGEVLFMYTDSEHDLNEEVLTELGIDVEQANQGG